MTDLTSNIRLAIDSGVTAIGVNTVIDSIKDNSAKLIVIAKQNKDQTMRDILHMAKVANIGVLVFPGNSMELGAVCGKPFSVSVLSVADQGNSKILEEDYSAYAAKQ